MGYELLIQTAEAPVRRLALDRDRCSLGRAHDNDLSYPEDASLSRRHLLFELDEAHWWVRDLGSKNGTLLNGARVSGRARLKPGDRLTAGQISITLVGAGGESEDPRVVFVPGAGAAPNEATVMTSLEGLLSGEATAPLGRPTSGGAHERQLRVLIRAGGELAQQRPLEELFQRILALSIEAVAAQRGVVMTLERESLVPRAVHGHGFQISTTIRDRVINEKASLLVRDMRQEEALRSQASIFQQRIHSLMAVPLQTEDRVIGLIYVDSSLLGREFTPDDLNLLTVLANVAGNRIEQERYQELRRKEERLTHELNQAAEIQRGILPRAAPVLSGLELADYNAPCRTVGGDYHDFISHPDGRVLVVLGDVAGKGMSAALLMSNLQARVQLLAEERAGLAAFMSRLNTSLARSCPSNRFISLFICLIDPAGGELVCCNAGHNPPLLVRASGDVLPLVANGTVLGILPHSVYEEQRERFAPGDLVALYSDGVTEAANAEGEEFGQQRLAELLVAHRTQAAPAIVGAITRAIDAFTSSAPAADDVTVVIARRTGPHLGAS